MKLRQGLIGLFALFFLLSSVGMVMLVMDDNKDLSSRASGPVQSGKRGPLGEVVFTENSNAWDGNSAGFPIQVAFDNAKWQAPQGTDNVFIHRSLPITVRVVSNDNASEAKIKTLLGPDFTFSKKGDKPNSYVFNFLGQPKNVVVWQSVDSLSLVSISPQGVSTDDIATLVSQVSLKNSKPQVKGASTADDSARLAALVRPSVVMILTNYCAKAKMGELPGTMMSGKQYPFCLAATGSGFFVNSDGYIGTNGHVVNIGTDTGLVAAVATGQMDELLTDFTYEYVKQTTGQEVSRDLIVQKIIEAKKSKESLYQLAGVVIQLKEKNLLSVTDEKYKYFVQVGATPITITKNSVNTGDDILEAKLIDSDYKEVDPVSGFTSSDVALLKVEGKNFPALSLGNSTDVSVGSALQVIGFPGVAGGTGSLLLDTSANSEPTVTKGVVSALKKAKGNQKNLIQTDASITHGNSGGPAVDSEGKVIGIATYGLIPEDGGGNYNFLRDIADLKALMDKNNVESSTGPTYTSWKNGLDSFWLSYYGYAKGDMEKVEQLYPAHPTVEKYLTEIKQKRGTSADKTPMFTRTQRRVYMAVSGVVMVGSLIAIVVLFIIEKTAKPKSPPTILAVSTNIPVAPTNQTQTVPQPPAAPTVTNPPVMTPMGSTPTPPAQTF